MTTKGRNRKIQKHIRNTGKIARTTKAVISGAAQEVKDKISTVPQNMTYYAKRNPLKTMGISLLAGVALAQLLRIRHK